MRIAFRLMVIVAVLLLGFQVSHAMGQFFFFENPLVGEPAPNFILNTLTKQGVDFFQYRAGQPAIVFFWATWCPHCRTQLKEIQRNQASLQKKGIKMVLIDLGESARVIKRYAEKERLDLDIFLDPDSRVGEAYGVIGLPTYYLVDQAGIVRAVEHEIPANYEDYLFTNASAEAK